MDATGVGRHAICEFWGATHLDSVERAEHALRTAAAAGNVTLIDVFVHQFSPHGVSGVAVIAESHLAIHTWPELDYVAADLFTCGENVDMDAIIGVLRDAFEADHVDVRFLQRGIPAETTARRFEEFEPGSASHASYDMTVVLEQRRTEFQEVVMFESPRLGRVMALDGIIQMTDLDTYVYHEMLAHPALFSHPNPRDVAVVGGGDVHLVAEVLKHPGIERVYLLELDEEVVQVSRKHYEVAREALNDPRVEVRPSDAFDSIAELHGELDVIMVDLTDPIGPAARLFEDEFYALCERSLRPDGMLVAQTESIHFHPEVVRDCFTTLSRRFAHTGLLWAAIATYPGAFWTFGFASKEHDPRTVRRRPKVESRLYDVDAHDWFFIPEPVRHRLLGI
ncbi:MAG TPA: polyamine aminopropyltransferase [Acidimicrobiia bacterium]|nr:polyamine aminopropyltransferase [Acidimicrobiia bacterium]